jgi:hypothetical protein
MEKVPDDVVRVVVGEDAPQGIERRLVLRLLGYWRSLPREEDFPSFAAIDPAQIPDMWGHSFVLETVGNETDPLFRAFGDEIAGRCGGGGPRREACFRNASKYVGVEGGSLFRRRSDQRRSHFAGR